MMRLGLTHHRHRHALAGTLTRLLREKGLALTDIVKATVFLTSIGDLDAVNEEYRAAFSEPFPARSLVEVSALPVADGVVEIEAWAIDPSWNTRQER